MTHLRGEVPSMTLTIRERQVLAAYIVQGRYAAGAKWLGMAPSTFRNHLTSIYKKAGAKSAVQALWKMGYVDPEAVIV